MKSPAHFLRVAVFAGATFASALPASAATTPETPHTLPGAETFVYRDGEPEPMRLHVFKPQDWRAGERRPALIHFFGGGFLRGTPLQSAGPARAAARLGMIGIAPDYRVHDRFGTDATACVADARAALRWVQDHAAELGIDPARIVVSGSSAGGHVALWTAITHTPPGSDPNEAPHGKPAALVLLSAAADTSEATGQRGDRFGGHGLELSPQQNLDDTMPPVLMFHGDADTTVPYRYAVALHDALVKRGGICEFITVPGGTHAFSSEIPEWKEKVAAIEKSFLEKTRILPAPGS